MPLVDFGAIQDSGLIPEGKYECEIISVDERISSSGAEMWKMRFSITKGQYAGRCISDFLTFSQKALKRIKCLCRAIGIKASGKINIEPSNLINNVLIVEIYHGEYRGKKQAKVPFAGFSAVETTEETTKRPSARSTTAITEGELPF